MNQLSGGVSFSPPYFLIFKMLYIYINILFIYTYNKNSVKDWVQQVTWSTAGHHRSSLIKRPREKPIEIVAVYTHPHT